MSVLEKLTEGIVNRDLQKEGASLIAKWEKTGLLEGLTNDNERSGMSRLLENQAKELLREGSSMAAGDVEGFAAVAFPLVRRVFGGLIANDLVSVQPMSLPSGLIFFLDFQHTNARSGLEVNDSVYGGGVVGQQLTGGVDLTGDNLEESFYSLNNGYSSPTGSTSTTAVLPSSFTVHAEGEVGRGNSIDRMVDFDPDLSGSYCMVVSTTGSSQWTGLNLKNLVGIERQNATTYNRLVRRLTKIHSGSTTKDDATSANLSIQLTFECTDDTKANCIGRGDASTGDVDGFMGEVTGSQMYFTFPHADNFGGTAAAGSTNALGAVVGADTWGLEFNQEIPEIDIKVDSVSVTAVTKKLKAKWTPELGQDLNAYHNLDAEVELTGILSEQIALEIDREILQNLVKGATAGTYHWSRRPGRFLTRDTGAEISNLANESLLGADFTGTVSEWYETLVETINDVSAQIHRKTLRGGANFIVVGPEVANVLEFTSGFRADVTGDDDRGSVGTVKTGSLSKKWDVYVDPYFLRNVVLVGRKGGSFLESGFVYAPYVPLQVTPTIFGVEDFVPRKGVMTRYAKKMVRPDMYGLVIVQDLLG
jgi:hypothetical protein